MRFSTAPKAVGPMDQPSTILANDVAPVQVFFNSVKCQELTPAIAMRENLGREMHGL
jgi:hypothetical protein